MTAKVMEVMKYNTLWTPNDFIVNVPPRLSKKNFAKIDLAYSKIARCIVKDSNGDIVSKNKTNYSKILLDIIKTMDKTVVLKKTYIKDEKYNDKGFVWYPEVKLSIQRKDANNTVKEFVEMAEYNKLSIYIIICLNSGEVIQYGKKI